MSEIESINLTLLKNFLDDAAPRYGTLIGSLQPLSALQASVLEGCGARGVACHAVPQTGTHIENMIANHTDAENIYSAMIQLGINGTNVTSSQLIDALGAGALEGPADMEIMENELYGLPPHSGYVDDPICAANGNFVHIDTDLETPGFGHVTNVVRTYNSLAAADRTERGRFGWGWSSTIDMRVDLRAFSLEASKAVGTVRIVLADGGSAYFTADADGAFAPNDVRQLNLQRVDNGWVLSKFGDIAWTFNAEGELTGGRHQQSTWVVTRTEASATETSIRITEVNSDRTVRYALVDGLVQRVVAGDGRRIDYRYEDGHCVRAVRAIGDVTYEIEANLIETIRDADGVLICTNDYDERGRTMGQLSPYGRHTSYEYLPQGVTRVSDPEHGRTNVLIHDNLGNLTAMFDGNGASMQMVWDHRSRAIKVTDRAGATTEFVYADGPEDLLLERIDADGAREVREYDELHRPIRQTGRAGGVRTWHYTGDSRLPSHVVEPDGGEIFISYDEVGLPVSITDADGVRTEWMWDRDGQVVASINGAGERTVNVYDATGQLVRTTDSMGRTETMVRNDAGRVVTHTDVVGRIEHISYTAAGRAVEGQVEGPGSWAATFGDHGLMSTVADALGSTVRFEYDDVGQMVEATAPDGLVHRLEYDDLGQLIAAVGPTGLRSSQTFDRAGRVVSFTDVEGNTVRRTLDALGRTLEAIDPMGERTAWSWHPNGELAHHTLPSGDEFTFEIDIMGRVIAEIAPDGGRTVNTWSPGGRLLEQVSPAGRVSTFSYDAAGRLITHTDADGTQTHFELRGDDKVDRIIAPDTVTNLSYNAEDDIVNTHISPAGHAPDVHLTNGDPFHRAISMPDRHDAHLNFDVRGLVERVADPAGIITEFTRDARGRLTGAQTGEHRQQMTWSNTGTMESLTDPLGQVKTWTYSPGGHYMGVQWDESLGRMLQRDANGRMTSITTPDGTPLASFVFDALGQLTAATNEHGTVTAEVDAYRVVHATTDLNGDTVTYKRDADGMLAGRSHSNGTSVAFTRSDAGRIIGITDSELGEVPLPTLVPNVIDDGGRIAINHLGHMFSYDTAGRIAGASTMEGATSAFTWNDLGLLATDTTPTRGRRTFTYDVAGQLEATSDERGLTVSFDYDIAGRRIAEHHSDGSSARFVWNELDQLVAIHRTDAAGRTFTRDLVWSGFNRPEKVDDLAISWDDAVTNKPVQIGAQRWLRSGRWIREATPGAEWHDGTTDDPWGDGGPLGVTLGYRGELSVDGLIIMGARVYDPATRTFLSRDPLPAMMGTNAFAGVYVYAWNDPVNFCDPTGLRPLSQAEFDDMLENRERSRFGSAWEAVKEDPLGAALLVTVIVVGTVLLIPPATALGAATLGVAGGLLIGAGATAAIGIHNKNFSPTGSAFNGLVGGATGALGPLSWGAQVAGGAAIAGTANGITQGFDPNTGLTGAITDGDYYEDGFSYAELGAATLGGALVPPGLGPGLGNRVRATGLGMMSGAVSDGAMQLAQNGGAWDDLDWNSIGISTAAGGLSENVGGRTKGGHVDFGPNRTSPTILRAEWGTDAAFQARQRADLQLEGAQNRLAAANEAVEGVPGRPRTTEEFQAVVEQSRSSSLVDVYEARALDAQEAFDAAVQNEVKVTSAVSADARTQLERRHASIAARPHTDPASLAESYETWDSVVSGWEAAAENAPHRLTPPAPVESAPPAPWQPVHPNQPDWSRNPNFGLAPDQLPTQNDLPIINGDLPPAKTVPTGNPPGEVSPSAVTGPIVEAELPSGPAAPATPTTAALPDGGFKPIEAADLGTTTTSNGAATGSGDLPEAPPRDPFAGLSDERAGVAANGEIIQMAP